MSASINPPQTEAYPYYRHWLLVHAREQKGYNQWQLADKSGISEPLLSAIEDGRQKMTCDQADTIGKLLSISPHYLYMTSMQLVNLRLCTQLFQHQKQQMEQEMLAARHP